MNDPGQGDVDDTVNQMTKGLDSHLSAEQIQALKDLMRQAVPRYAEQGPNGRVPESQQTVVDPKILRRVTPEQYPDLPSMSREKKQLDFVRRYSLTEYERIGYGLSPVDMDEKWITILKGETLRMWRSWPPNPCIFEIGFRLIEGSYQTNETWVAQGFLRHPNIDTAYAVELLDYLIQRMLLGHVAHFPFPQPITKSMDRMMFRHGMVGSSLANGEP